MTPSAQVFDTHLPAFKEMQSAPWGRLRYSLVMAKRFFQVIARKAQVSLAA